ncbi:MAG: hypothetical protein LKM45_02590 [Wolbachia endosymbiont of Alcedoecus sp.]|nr:hypothetical protein [Wolbachia endosymbiont of Alcedoecus sp.]
MADSDTENPTKEFYKELLIKQLLEKVHKKHTSNSKINVTFSNKVSENLVGFSKVSGLSVQEAANKLMLEIINLEEDMMEIGCDFKSFCVDENLNKNSGINVTFNHRASERLERLAERTNYPIQI